MWLLNEELTLPSVGAWWCGDAPARQRVTAGLHEMVVKRIYPAAGRAPVFGRLLDPEERVALASEIHAHPGAFVGQEQTMLSSAPVWIGNKLERRPVVLRAFVAWAGTRYIVMPGGLTRVAAGRGLSLVSMQRGGGSKDTWVLSDGPVTHVTLLPTAPVSVRSQRRAADASSS